jgi:hypothetical protein
MTGPTRQKALAKFDRFYAKVGHPEKWRDYSTVAIRPDGYYANVEAATEFEVKRTLARLGQPVDKTEWEMSPPTVNAYFDPTANNINFPAGILQPPFFDFSLDDAVNYGGIGVVIGHEITHGFDDQGRHYDGDGNLAEWWTPEDAAAFEARAQKVVDQFNSYEALPGLHVNGRLTLGENIADLGGVSVAYEALQGHRRPHTRTTFLPRICAALAVQHSRKRTPAPDHDRSPFTGQLPCDRAARELPAILRCVRNQGGRPDVAEARGSREDLVNAFELIKFRPTGCRRLHVSGRQE